jgi:hypothetical protein
MNLPEADQDFLRALVKRSRQQSHPVRWRDRDGSERITMLSSADATRLNQLAQQLRIGMDALLRQAAHLPADPRPASPSREPPVAEGPSG